jgi:hypothetical protein
MVEFPTELLNLAKSKLSKTKHFCKIGKVGWVGKKHGEISEIDKIGWMQKLQKSVQIAKRWKQWNLKF